MDLCAAFDSVEHDVLLERLERQVGLSDPVLNWFGTFLSGQEFVTLGEHNSQEIHITCGTRFDFGYGIVQFIYFSPWQHYQKAHN